ncbi:hypothetical protein [Methanosphaera sp. WGK6]|uniref:hypothetical protein n=1 Tax=Methanosphaera sp. WGK6 TaxID=1561964 RepID=UPI00084CA75C|nr:hypothetical protein [Methanosphaera sp. WGK6]OED29550.1 hypothetical protein NL43_07625 [Methanosphaera sp. WGK6]
MTKTIYCSNCGTKNNTQQTHCKNCEEYLHNFKEETRQINNITELFTEKHYHNLTDKILTIEAYEVIIENIITTGENKIIYKKNMSPLERITAIAEAYTKVIYKNKGNNYGEYAYNILCIDQQFDPAIQIATILHELTHHLFNEIIKEILMYIWNVKKTTMLDSFVQTILTIPSLLLISEYCASSTEKTYLPEQYVSYSSFNNICEQINYDKTIILRGFIIGKSMSESIIKILDSFIDKTLYEEIKQEFKKNKTKPIAKTICTQDTSINNPILRNVYLMNILITSYELSNDKEVHKKLNKNKEYFEKSYAKILKK